MNDSDKIKEARTKYDSYSSQWKRDYFNSSNGGYLVVETQRIEQGNISKQEKAKYNKEYDMCLTLAKNGYKVEYLKITEGSFDVYVNNVSADLKKTSGSRNIEKYAKKATREQGAKLVVFEFLKETEEIYAEIENLKKIGIHRKYYFTNKKNSIQDF